MRFSVRGRGWLARWVAPVLVLALLAGVVWLAGGFRAAPAEAGPTAQLGQKIELARWTITVQRIALVNTDATGYEEDPRFRVWATITNTSDESLTYLNDGLIETLVPGGPKTGSLMVASEDIRGSQFDPDITRKVVLEFNWPERAKDADTVPLLPAPDQVSVIIRDERLTDGFLSGEGWGIGRPAAVITVPLDDQRKQR